MANVKLPKTIDPAKSAQKRAIYEGIYVKGDLLRFADAVAKVESDAQVRVEFSKDAQGLTYFHGQADAAVRLVCQRCNNDIALQVSSEFCFSPVQGNDDANELPERYEPIEIDEHGAVDLLQVVEDELILALPIVALHTEEDCKIKVADLQFGKIDEVQAKPNPFAILKELKRD